MTPPLSPAAAAILEAGVAFMMVAHVLAIVSTRVALPVLVVGFAAFMVGLVLAVAEEG